MATRKKTVAKPTKAKASKGKRATTDKAVKPKVKTKAKATVSKKPTATKKTTAKKNPKATAKVEVKVEVKPEVEKRVEPIAEKKHEKKVFPRCKYCGSFHVTPSGYCKNCIRYGLDSLNRMFGSTDGWDKRLPKKREPVKTGWRGTWGEALRNVRTN